MISKDTNHKNHYALITYRWMDMNEVGDIKLPTLPNVAITIEE